MTSRFDRVNSLDKSSKAYYDLINFWFPHGFRIHEICARAKVDHERALFFVKKLMYMDLLEEHPQRDATIIYRKKK